MSFKEETMYALHEHNKTVNDIRWIGVFTRKSSYQIPIDEFFANADFSYDRGYGVNEISLGLRIVGDDWWLERCEYDGSEWWEFKRIPKMPTVVQHVANKKQLVDLVSSWTTCDYGFDDEDDDDDDEIES